MTEKPTADALALEFVAIIRKEMTRRKMTMSALAELVGVPRQNVSELLNHPGAIRTSTIEKWFNALDMHPQLKAKRNP